MTDKNKFAYHDHLSDIVEADMDYVKRKDVQYDSSWKKRGGVGAFFTIVRPWDRLASMMAEIRPAWSQFDLFGAIAVEGLTGPDGSIIACVRDLRRYLLLLEAHMVQETLPKPEHVPTIMQINRGPAAGGLLLYDADASRPPEVIRMCAHCGSGIVRDLAAVTETTEAGTKHFHGVCHVLMDEARAKVMERKVPRRDPPAAPEGPVSWKTEDDSDSSRHASLTPWVVSRQWLRRNGMVDGVDGHTAACAAYFTPVAQFTWKLEPHVEGVSPPVAVLARLYDMASDGWLLRITDCPPAARVYFPTLPLERNSMEHGDMPRWQQNLYEWFEIETKWKLAPEHAAWAAEGEPG